MSNKIETLYKKATGTHPKNMEPHPTHAQMVKEIQTRRTAELRAVNFETNAVIYERDTDPSTTTQYEISVDQDGDGTYTTVYDKQNSRVAFLDGDKSRDPTCLGNILQSMWDYCPDPTTLDTPI